MSNKIRTLVSRSIRNFNGAITEMEINWPSNRLLSIKLCPHESFSIKFTERLNDSSITSVMAQGANHPIRTVFSEIKVFFSFLAKAGKESNIHGLKYIFSSNIHPVERILWVLVFFASCYAAYSISSQQYNRYVANPTVISLERDYRDWNGTLPAVSVCYHKRIDEARAEALIKRLWSCEKHDDEYSYFMDFIKAVVNVNESYTKFNRFANDRRLEFVNMLNIVKDVHPTINSVISSFDTNAEFAMREIITEKGICYSINSVISPLISTV